jgi:cystathionine gamma-lyase
MSDNSHSKPLRFETIAVHAGCDVDQAIANAVVPQISLSTTFSQSYPGVRPGVENPNSFGAGFFYSRMANPTRGALERALAAVEGAKYCCAFASGMAAINTVIQLLKSGDHIIALDDLYGGTTGLFNQVVTPGSGINFTFMSLDDISEIEAACTPQTKLIWLETPTNPLLKTTDLKALTTFAKTRGIKVAVDATFLSPYLQKPLDFGADYVVHSLTKYIAGHSDVLMGAVLTNDEDAVKRMRSLQSFCGAVPSPFDCYLSLRGLKTLHLRVEASMQNAMFLAEKLEKHSVLERVIYPGLRSYPQYELAKRQSKGPGAMITIHIKGGLPAAGKFLSELKVFALAVSLGAVESLACSPAIMTHTAVPAEQRARIGLTDSLIRLSIGVENKDDLWDDLKQALDKANELYLASESTDAAAPAEDNKEKKKDKKNKDKKRKLEE